MIDPTHGWNVSVKPTIWGFVISILLTLLAYFIATASLFTGLGLAFVLIGLAIIQGIIQLVFYLHLGIESKPRWNLMIFLFMVLLMGIILVGSMVIMRSLDYNLMHPDYKMKSKNPQ